MEETVHQRQTSQHRTDESSEGTRDDSAMEAASRAVARLLANPRRTRRD